MPATSSWRAWFSPDERTAKSVAQLSATVTSESESRNFVRNRRLLNKLGARHGMGCPLLFEHYVLPMAD